MNPQKGGMTEQKDSQNLIRGLEIGALIFLAGAIAVAALMKKKGVALAIGAGGLVTVIQFRILQHVCRRMISMQMEQGRGGIFGLIFLKTGFPLVAFGLIFWKLKMNELGFVIGLGAFPAAVFGYAIWLILKSFLAPSSDESENHGESD